MHQLASMMHTCNINLKFELSWEWSEKFRKICGWEVRQLHDKWIKRIMASKSPPDEYQNCNNSQRVLVFITKWLSLVHKSHYLDQYHPITTWNIRVILPRYDGFWMVYRPWFYQRQNYLQIQVSHQYQKR